MNKTLLLLGGLGLGAGLMYILDAEQGARRRAQVRDQVVAYRRHSDSLLGQTQQTLSRGARGFLPQAYTPLRLLRRPDKMQLPYGGQKRNIPSLRMLGYVGLGVGLMYVLDPATGTRRRALICDKARSYWHRTEGFIEKTARDARNRTRGLMADARIRLRGAEVPSETVLASRVRAQIGHVISNAGAIDVTVHQGSVALRGPIPADEVDKLLSTVESVPGVTEVVNQLEVLDETTHSSGLQSHNPTR